MPTFHITLLGNVFRSGALVSANLRIVAPDLETAEALASEYAQVNAIHGSQLHVDAVYEMSETVRVQP